MFIHEIDHSNMLDVNEFLKNYSPLTFSSLDVLMHDIGMEYLTTYENLTDIITSKEFRYYFKDKETNKEYYLVLNWQLADDCKYSKYEIMQAVNKYQDAVNYAVNNNKSTKNLKEFDKVYEIWKTATIEAWYNHEEKEQ